MGVLVLLANAEETSVERVQRYVESAGAGTFVVPDTCEAMRHFEMLRPDLTVLFVEADDPFSMAVCGEMKTHGGGHRRAVIVVAPRESRSAAFEMGCDAFVERQEDDRPLLLAIRKFLIMTKRRAQPTAQTRVSP